MSKRGIVPDCPDCDIEPDGAPDGHCCTVIFCDLHLAAGRVAREIRVEAVTQAMMARIYRADARACKAQGFPGMAADNARIGAIHRRIFTRLLQTVRLSRPKAVEVRA